MYNDVMSTNRPFTAATNKLAYAQSFARPTIHQQAQRTRGYRSARVFGSGVVQSFVHRHPYRHAAGRHRNTAL